MTQNFKGDAFELQMQAAGAPAFSFTTAALEDFYNGCYEAGDFLLMLYDSGRMPFSDRVPRDSFVAFIKEQLANAQTTGTFETYLFILRSIFGASSDILFDVPAPGKLEILINISDALEFDFHGREIVDGAYEDFEMITWDGDTLQFRGIPGIDSAAELEQLLSELIPAGIYTTVELAFFTLFNFVAEDNLGVLDQVVDHLGNQIIFFETGE